MIKDNEDAKSGKQPTPIRGERPAQEEIPMPTCPYCGTRPARVHSTPFELIPGVTAVTIYCATPGCNRILSTQIIGGPPQPPQNRIILPN